jgi:hypothetical protein
MNYSAICIIGFLNSFAFGVGIWRKSDDQAIPIYDKVISTYDKAIRTQDKVQPPLEEFNMETEEKDSIFKV